MAEQVKEIKRERFDSDDAHGLQDPRDDDSCHGDSGLLNMLAEVASATLHNDSLARRTRNPRGRPRKQTTEAKVKQDLDSDPVDSNKLTLAQLQLLTEKQLVDLFALMDSDEIRRTFSYSCHLLQRCQFTSSSFGSEMKARQEMQKHLSEHVRDLMRKARENPNFRFAALPVVSKAKKAAPQAREPRVSPVRKPKDKLKVKLQPKQKSPSKAKGRTPKKEAESPRAKATGRSTKTKEELSIKREPSFTKKKNANAVVEEQLGMDQVETNAEEVTVKDKWLKLYRDKYRAVDEARFRAIQADRSTESDVEPEFGEVAEEVVVTSEEPVASSSSSSLPDHDYNIYQFNKRASTGANSLSGSGGHNNQVRNQDEQMEAVAQSVAAAAQEKEKLKRKRTTQGVAKIAGVPLHSFMMEETTKQSKVVVKNKPTEPLPCVGSEVVVGYNPSEFYLMKSSELPVIEDLRQKGSTATPMAQPQFTFVCMNEEGELIEETVEDPPMFLEDEDQLLVQVAAQASIGQAPPEKDVMEMARKRAKIKPKFVSQSDGERDLALQYIAELKQQRGSGADSLHCKICTPVRTFTAPTTLLSHYRSHAGIKPYECRRCGAVFTRQHSLNYHMLIHANLSRFTCPDCHRQFRHPSHYKEHRRRHTGEAPYECSDCMQRFRTRNSYKRHLMTRHGKLLTSNGGLIILPEEEFNKVRCKPRPVRGRAADAVATGSVSSAVASKVATEVAASDSAMVVETKNSTKSGARPKVEVDSSGNFEQQRQEDLIRLLYQRLTSPNEHSSADSNTSSRSSSPVPLTSEPVENQLEHIVVDSPEVAAAVVVESIPSNQVVEEQCEVVTEEAWGSSFISLTVDGQNNVIFLDENQTAAELVEGTTVVIEEDQLVQPARRSTIGKSSKMKSLSRVKSGAVSPLATSSGDVDLLSFVHNAGVMVQHILDIQTENPSS